MKSTTPLYTIGYATKPIEVFIAQLQKYKINVIADIRSVPYSNAFADYHRENIRGHLSRHHIRYVYLGDELGPRSKDDKHYDERGQVQFDRLMQASFFHAGLARLKLGFEKNFTIALMCAEKDPATCHRSLLITYYLARNSNAVIGEGELKLLHINHEGNIETQEALEDRLMSLHDQGEDLFMSRDERKAAAYKTQLEKTSYIKN